MANSSGRSSVNVGSMSSARLARVAAPLREQVLDVLRADIVALRLRPGQRLVERELIEHLGVSRTTVREALRQLTTEGLAREIPQKGLVVAAPTPTEAAELYEVRALLEGAAAKEFALKASAAQLRELAEAFDEVNRSRFDIEGGGFLEAKNRLYEILLEGAGNSTIRSILQTLQARIAVLRAATVAVPGRAEASVEELGAIVDAIKRRDGDAAASTAAFHVRQAAATLFDAMARKSSPVLESYEYP